MKGDERERKFGHAEQDGAGLLRHALMTHLLSKGRTEKGFCSCRQLVQVLTRNENADGSETAYFSSLQHINYSTFVPFWQGLAVQILFILTQQGTIKT